MERRFSEVFGPIGGFWRFLRPPGASCHARVSDRVERREETRAEAGAGCFAVGPPTCLFIWSSLGPHPRLLLLVNRPAGGTLTCWYRWLLPAKAKPRPYVSCRGASAGWSAGGWSHWEACGVKEMGAAADGSRRPIWSKAERQTLLVKPSPSPCRHTCNRKHACRQTNL